MKQTLVALIITIASIPAFAQPKLVGRLPGLYPEKSASATDMAQRMDKDIKKIAQISEMVAANPNAPVKYKEALSALSLKMSKTWAFILQVWPMDDNAFFGDDNLPQKYYDSLYMMGVQKSEELPDVISLIETDGNYVSLGGQDLDLVQKDITKLWDELYDILNERRK